MPSPFPGMDPYLESPAIWSDFHATFLGSLRAELNKGLPAPYIARLDRYVWIDEPDAEEPQRLGKPDAYVADPVGVAGEGQVKVATLAAPVTVLLPVVERKGKLFIKVIDPRGHRVITVVELLSPANKSPGRDRQAYLTKRAEYLATGINLVEMDLLREGARPPVAQPLPPADYYIIVSRDVDFPAAGVWPSSVRDPWPTIQVPLKPEDEPHWLSLGPAFARAFDEGLYAQEIDYDEPPEPPLREPDATWARELLANRPR